MWSLNSFKSVTDAEFEPSEVTFLRLMPCTVINQIISKKKKLNSGFQITANNNWIFSFKSWKQFSSDCKQKIYCVKISKISKKVNWAYWWLQHGVTGTLSSSSSTEGPRFIELALESTWLSLWHSQGDDGWNPLNTVLDIGIFKEPKKWADKTITTCWSGGSLHWQSSSLSASSS